MSFQRVCLGKRVLEVMAGLQLYRFEPECVPNLEDGESEILLGMKYFLAARFCMTFVCWAIAFTMIF